MKKRSLYLLVAGILILGILACGKENSLNTREMTTTEIGTEALSTEEETTQVTTEDSDTQETDGSNKGNVTEESDTGTQETGSGDMTSEEAEKLLFQTLGEKDEETDNTYSFGYVDTFTIEGTGYHMFVWSWLVDDHSSRLADLFVAVDGSAIYEGLYNGETAEVFKEKNYLKD
ncbi:MAG: hypothetical protein HFJ06_01050 [Lachnospiraceae bacterium]|mgnify:FL=1|nr:hypothetical protein [Lachnospiraceae bacterium]